MTSMTGGCLCGRVRFSATDVETHHHACHCGMCRRWNGGPAFSAAVGGIRFESADEIAVYASSDWAERGFCGHCGSNLFYRMIDKNAYYVSVGAFDDPAPFVLSGEIFVDHQPAGYRFAGDQPRLTEAETLALIMGEA